MKFHLRVVFVSVLLIAYSCTPSDDDPSSPISKEEMLTYNGSKTWKMTKLKHKTTGASIIKDCMLTDFYTFNINKNFTATDKCNGPTQTYSSAWLFIHNKDSIQIPLKFGVYGQISKAKIVELSESKLIISAPILINGVTAEGEATLIPQ